MKHSLRGVIFDKSPLQNLAKITPHLYTNEMRGYFSFIMINRYFN